MAILEAKTLQKAILYFSNADNCLQYMASKRWPDGLVICPTCGRADVSFVATRRVWQCKSRHAKSQFSLKVGTIFEDSPLGLEKWLPVLWMIANCKNGVSSYEIKRDVGVTQRTAWFMLHRIRKGMDSNEYIGPKMRGEIEADETYIGGKAIIIHKATKERRMKQGRLKKRRTDWQDHRHGLTRPRDSQSTGHGTRRPA